MPVLLAYRLALRMNSPLSLLSYRTVRRECQAARKSKNYLPTSTVRFIPQAGHVMIAMPGP